MNLNIKIIEGRKAFDLLKEKSFISRWTTLAASQKSATVHQEHPFVSTWYHQYQNKFQPVFILGFDNNSEIIGILALAQNLESQEITHAGAWQAEYKGWICHESIIETFPVQALISLKNHFNLNVWNWGWTPPKLNTDWLSSKALKKENINIIYTEEDSPLMALLNEERLNKIKKNKSTKNQINRYIKRGGFFIERITSKEKAEQVFDILVKQSDFRHLAIHNEAPFGNDSNKKPFHINRLEFKDSNHFTVLWSNNKPIAFNFGECNKETVFLGLTSYDPTESKNSPGKIFLIKLAEFIKEEGYKYLDLTPGGDSYKDSFSNSTQKLHETTIYFNRIKYLESKSKEALKNSLKKANLNSETLPNIFNPNKAKKLPSSKGIFTYYLLKADDVNTNSLSNAIFIKKNHYEDLLLLNRDDKPALLSRALRQFATDDILFSITDEEKLMLFGWLTTRLNNKNIPDLNFNIPDQSAILYDFFSENNFTEQEHLTKCIYLMINTCKKKGIKNIFIRASHNNSFLNTIKNIGFKKF